ncbi:MAG: TatD family hydrolase [Eggerthellaceae bacterium]|nr:TatD family hydrolase [Eggerthellaceae bacterium]
MMTPMHDMHCHLGFMDNGEDVAAEALDAGTLLFANAVTPAEWLDARERFSRFGNVAIGFGMHPWWVTGGSVAETVEDGGAKSQRERRREAQQRALELMQDAPEGGESEAQTQRNQVIELLDVHDPILIGEVGLDFGWNHISSRGEQLAMFDAIASWAAKRNGKLLSIHAVKASREAFGILEQSGALEACTCVFHWFTGPSDLLKQAVQAGCFFSCGPRMLATGKGREYVKAIPADRLLLETDAPPQQGMPYSYSELRAELEHVAADVAALKGIGILETIAHTSESILSPAIAR